MTDLIAGCDNIARMWGLSDHAVVLRRMHEYTFNGLSAASLAETVSSSGHSDPTVAAALSAAPGDRVDLTHIALVHQWATRILERAMAHELARPTTPTKAQAEATDVGFDNVAVFRPGAGVCEACGRDYPGGRKNSDRVHNVEGHLMCYSHKTGRSGPRHKNRTVEDYIHSVKLYMGQMASTT